MNVTRRNPQKTFKVVTAIHDLVEAFVSGADETRRTFSARLAERLQYKGPFQFPGNIIVDYLDSEEPMMWDALSDEAKDACEQLDDLDDVGPADVVVPEFQALSLALMNAIIVETLEA